MKNFLIYDCALLTRTSGLPAALNLRELRERLASCSSNVIYHHFCETPMVASFDNPDYRNDVAVWVKLHLGDRVLAERLGIIDPYAFFDMEELRTLTLDLIDERLSELPFVPSAPDGSEFFFMESTTVVFDTGRTIEHPRDLASSILTMTGSSIYFHFLEARRRHPENIDDFSSWLMDSPEKYHSEVKALHSIDFSFYTLSELRNELAKMLSHAGGTP